MLTCSDIFTCVCACVCVYVCMYVLVMAGMKVMLRLLAY